MAVMQGRRLIAASLLVIVFGACSDDDDTGAAPRSNGNDPVVAHLAEGNGFGNAALIAGTLDISGGCLLVAGLPVVWPYGTTWNAEAKTVRLPDSQEISLGDRVSGAGGYPYLSDLDTELSEPLAGCPTNRYEEVAMFNADDQITVTK